MTWSSGNFLQSKAKCPDPVPSHSFAIFDSMRNTRTSADSLTLQNRTKEEKSNADVDIHYCNKISDQKEFDSTALKFQVIPVLSASLMFCLAIPQEERDYGSHRSFLEK